MYGGFRYDVGVEAVAEIDGVNVVAGAKLACVELQKREELRRARGSQFKL
jgi:hypothetical protein